MIINLIRAGSRLYTIAPVPERQEHDMPSRSNQKKPSSKPAPSTPAPRPSNRQKTPDDWVTADEPMTGAQATYLKTLSEEAGEEFDPTLSKAAASKRIDALQNKTGRGRKKKS